MMLKIYSSEMYLIRAETRKPDKLISAAADMDLLRTARASFASSLLLAEAIDDIMSERRIELAFEGHRF